VKLYEGVIEIWLEPAFSRFAKQQSEYIRELRPLRREHNRARDFEGVSQERALGDLLWQRICLQDDNAGLTGYVGSFTNCVFKLLYGVFGTDTIAFLFDEDWVPKITIESFRPRLFLERLAILEKAAQELQDGAELPVRLKETTAFLRADMGPTLERFEKQKHRLLLDASLRELRDFGELGRSLEQANEKLRVWIQIWAPYGVQDAEILKFSSKP